MSGIYGVGTPFVETVTCASIGRTIVLGGGGSVTDGGVDFGKLQLVQSQPNPNGNGAFPGGWVVTATNNQPISTVTVIASVVCAGP